MNCPNCGHAMDKGNVQIKDTVLGIIFVGVSYQHLFFTRSDGDRQIAVHSCDVVGAYRCPSCNWLVIGGVPVPEEAPSFPPEPDGPDADLFEPDLGEPDFPESDSPEDVPPAREQH